MRANFEEWSESFEKEHRYEWGSALPRLLFKEQFAGAAGGLDDGLDERDAELPFFEFEDAVDGAAGGSGDGIFQERRMIAGFEDYAGGAFHGLRGEEGRDVAGQADFYAGLGEGFENN